MSGYPCPICGADPRRREQLRGGSELCTGCGYAIRLDEHGALVEWATTNKSHPRGVWQSAAATAVVALAIALTMAGCAPAATAHTAPTRPAVAQDIQRVVLGDDLLPDASVCVPIQPVPTEQIPLACMPLKDLRRLLRELRLAELQLPPMNNDSPERNRWN